MFRIIPEGKNFKEYILLKDGQGIFLRACNSEDFTLVKEFLNNLSIETLRLRFMASISYVSESIIHGLCDGDFLQDGCILAISENYGKKEIIGLANYLGMGNGRSAEVAFIVREDFQGKGIGQLLLEKLAGIGAANGLVEFEAEVLPENFPMLSVFKKSGFDYHQIYGTDVVHVEFPVDGAAAVWKRSELREKIASANSIRPILFPKNIAVIGVSRDESSVGNLILRNISSAGFNGNIFAVNKFADEIEGFKVYSSMSELPEEVDLAVISIPAEDVYQAASSAINKGAHGLIIVSAGFAEAGEKGKERQEKLVQLVREQGVRLLGPSCLGVMNSNEKVNLNASLVPNLIPKGNAGFYSHSAALGLVIIDYAKELGLGFTTFVSAGNRADVSGNDLLQYWEEDPETKMAILYLETFGNPRKFVRIARSMSYKKPILCVKSAHSNLGISTIKQKSGKEVVAGYALDGLFEQTGIIKTNTLEELFDVAVILAHQPLPKGNRLSIITNSAGMATILADAAEGNNLLSEEQEMKNLGAFATAEDYEQAVWLSALSEKSDILIIGFASFGNINPNEISTSIFSALNKVKIKKTVVLCFMGKAGTVILDEENDCALPSFRFPESAVNAVGKIVNYTNFIKNPLGKLAWYSNVFPDKARREINKLLINDTDNNELIKVSADIIKKVFDDFGIMISDCKIITDNELKIKVIHDSLFGPIILTSMNNGKEFIRITPLTESDIAELCNNLKLQNNTIISELFGRVSQIIEEIPWIWEMSFTISDFSELLLNPDIRILIKTGKIEKPEY